MTMTMLFKRKIFDFESVLLTELVSSVMTVLLFEYFGAFYSHLASAQESCGEPPPFPVMTEPQLFPFVSKSTGSLPDSRTHPLDNLTLRSWTETTGQAVGDSVMAYCVKGLWSSTHQRENRFAIFCDYGGIWRDWGVGPCIFKDLQEEGLALQSSTSGFASAINALDSFQFSVFTPGGAQTLKEFEPWWLCDVNYLYDLLLVHIEFAPDTVNIMHNFEIATLTHYSYGTKPEGGIRCAFYREVIPTTSDTKLCCLGPAQVHYLVVRLIGVSEVLTVYRVKYQGFACPAGRTGDWCESVVDVCTSEPCQHGATCVGFGARVDYPGSFACSCLVGYSGRLCETDINECESSPCKHGSTCNDLENLYSCKCSVGYIGDDCETEINECASKPCVEDDSHSSVCTDGIGSYTCNCKFAYVGLDCGEYLGSCVSSPCLNGASCAYIEPTDSYSCYACPVNFTGSRCETKIDENECSSRPCHNGGTCINYINWLSEDNYSCKCSVDFFGKYCENDVRLVNECSSMPCHNNGTCLDYLSSYTCECRVGYQGHHCEFKIEQIQPVISRKLDLVSQNIVTGVEDMSLSASNVTAYSFILHFSPGSIPGKFTFQYRNSAVPKDNDWLVYVKDLESPRAGEELVMLVRGLSPDGEYEIRIVSEGDKGREGHLKVRTRRLPSPPHTVTFTPRVDVNALELAWPEPDPQTEDYDSSIITCCTGGSSSRGQQCEEIRCKRHVTSALTIAARTNVDGVLSCVIKLYQEDVLVATSGQFTYDLATESLIADANTLVTLPRTSANTKKSWWHNIKLDKQAALYGGLVVVAINVIIVVVVILILKRLGWGQKLKDPQASDSDFEMGSTSTSSTGSSTDSSTDSTTDHVTVLQSKLHSSTPDSISDVTNVSDLFHLD